MINISIPDAVEAAMKLPEKEKQREVLKLLAAKMYEKGILGIGKASELCGLSRQDFMVLLREENIVLNYDDEELQRDLKNLEFFK